MTKMLRCKNCFQKSLIIEKCKCEHNFCLDCLPNFNHQCAFNWKEEKKRQLELNNPVIIPQKVEQI